MDIDDCFDIMDHLECDDCGREFYGIDNDYDQCLCFWCETRDERAKDMFDVIN